MFTKWFPVKENTLALVCTLGRPGTHFTGFAKSTQHYCGVIVSTERMRLCGAPNVHGEELSWNRLVSSTCVFESPKSEVDKTSKIIEIGSITKS